MQKKIKFMEAEFPDIEMLQDVRSPGPALEMP